MYKTHTTMGYLIKVEDEIARQKEIWGVQNHDAQRYACILLEEAGEVMMDANDLYWDDGKQDSAEVLANLKIELVQVAAVAVSMAAALDRCYTPEGKLKLRYKIEHSLKEGIGGRIYAFFKSVLLPFKKVK